MVALSQTLQTPPSPPQTQPRSPAAVHVASRSADATARTAALQRRTTPRDDSDDSDDSDVPLARRVANHSRVPDSQHIPIVNPVNSTNANDSGESSTLASLHKGTCQSSIGNKTFNGNTNSSANKTKSNDNNNDDDDDDEDIPLSMRLAGPKPIGVPVRTITATKPPLTASALAAVTNPIVSKTTVSASSPSVSSKRTVPDSPDSESDDDVPLMKRARTMMLDTSSKIKVKKESSITESRHSNGIKTSTTTNSPKRRKKVKSDDDGEEDRYKWWLEHKPNTVGGGGPVWKTLSHNGPYFPPPYTPHGVSLLYEGHPVKLSPASEEVATFYAAVVDSEIAQNPVFRKNFFHDFLKVLKQNEPVECVIKDYAKCDFSLIAEHLAKEKEKRKNMTKEEKEAVKQEKKEIEDQYGWAMLDGHKEKVGNFRIEPPGLFRGRGEHPRTGCLKRRIVPEQVTINIGKGEKIPEPPAGHKWGDIQHDNTVTWLAMYKETVNDGFKYVFLAANSSLKGKSDFLKFEKARSLAKYIKRIRADYTRDLRDKKMFIRQRATAVYLIDRLALRAGNEKGDDEADTVGCCSLRCEHVKLLDDNKVEFDFLGKDSIRYYNQVKVIPQVWKNIRLFMKEPKKGDDSLFDRLNTTLVNKHLSTYMKGLSAKVFRTYNASHTFQIELKKTVAEATVNEKILAYQRANREVAILCNHQRAVPKMHEQQIGRIGDRIKACKYELTLYKKTLQDLDSSFKNKHPEMFEPESDLDDEFTEEYKKQRDEQLAEKIAARLKKENEKRAESGQKQLETLDDATISALNGFPSTLTAERCLKKIDNLKTRISAYKLQKVEKDENKTTALGTSKINYIDPRISAAWCYQYDVPIEKIFNRALRDKFQWALDVKPTWKF